MVALNENPYYLNEEEIQWVKNTLASMTEDEKIGQLLCPSFNPFSKEEVNHLVHDIHIGAAMIRPMPSSGLKEAIDGVQKLTRVPLLISANLENGGSGALQNGTFFANPLGVAATGNLSNAYRLGKISCAEASSVGVNWGYAPIIDIDLNYHNPITNVRTFGNDVSKVLACAREYIRAAKEENVLPAIKHFPGDGVDERDQHLLVSVNSLSYEDYCKQHGFAYKTLIEEGIPTIMAGHIAAPEVVRHVHPDASGKELFAPASQSADLIQHFLRDELHFHGIVITDSTLMVGYMETMSRKKALATSINAGVDMILFSRNVDEDFRYLKEAFSSGIISKERLDEACTRILGMKAKLGLSHYTCNNKDADRTIAEIQRSGWVKECADEAVTLVKDNCHLVPISAKKQPRMYLNVIETVLANESPFAMDIKSRFEKMGFKVTLRKRKIPELTPEKLFRGELNEEEAEALNEVMASTDDFVSSYDIAALVINLETASNNTTLRINWKVLFGMGNDIPWYAGEMPLLVISTSNPYHLLDVPMADAYINTYSSNKETLDALFEKLEGKSGFKGNSPVDPFCGHDDTRI